MIMITKLIMLGIAVVCAVTLIFILLEFVEDKLISKFLKKETECISMWQGIKIVRYGFILVSLQGEI